jgi:hypothetical protein
MNVDEEDKLIMLCIRTICAAACVIILAMSGCVINSDYQNRMFRTAVFTNVQDPISVGCAVGTISSNADLCQLHTLAKKL